MLNMHDKSCEVQLYIITELNEHTNSNFISLYLFGANFCAKN